MNYPTGRGGPNNLLFTSGDLRDVTTQAEARVKKDTDAWPADDLLNRPEHELVEALTADHLLTAPVPDTDGIQVLDDDQEVIHELGGFPYATQRGATVPVRFRRITFAVPFTGDPKLFTLQPSTFTLNPPRGTIHGSELHLHWESPANEQATAEQVRTWLDQQLAAIQNYLTSTVADVEAHNQQIKNLAAGHVAARRAKLVQGRELRNALGYPLRRRDDAASFAVPVTRKKIQTSRVTPAAPTGKTPDPYLADADYEAVLGTLLNLRNALERSPRLVAGMGEELVRDWLLVGLNAVYEGRAAGEVFNGDGKTDILVREQDKNVFIGECKIWRGPKTIPDTLNQLLGYLTWRDTKAALLLFIRGQDKMDVIAKALVELKNHPNFRAQAGDDTEGERYNFRFASTRDPQQIIRVAFMPFAF